jgi:hypothetical protein
VSIGSGFNLAGVLSGNGRLNGIGGSAPLPLGYRLNHELARGVFNLCGIAPLLFSIIALLCIQILVHYVNYSWRLGLNDLSSARDYCLRSLNGALLDSYEKLFSLINRQGEMENIRRELKQTWTVKQ